MADELKFPDPSEQRGARDKDALDERTTRAIRNAYRPPSHRVMRRTRTGTRSSAA